VVVRQPGAKDRLSGNKDKVTRSAGIAELRINPDATLASAWQVQLSFLSQVETTPVYDNTFFHSLVAGYSGLLPYSHLSRLSSFVTFQSINHYPNTSHTILLPYNTQHDVGKTQ
jgi:hypothetical protein